MIVTDAADETVPAETLIVVLVALTAPGVTVIVGSSELIETPPMVPVIVVAVPEATPVNVAV